MSCSTRSQPITKCVDVHVHLIGASLPRPGAAQERVQRAYEVGVVPSVVLDEWTKQPAAERLPRVRADAGQQQYMRSQIRTGHDRDRPGEADCRVMGVPRLFGGAG